MNHIFALMDIGQKYNPEGSQLRNDQLEQLKLLKLVADVYRDNLIFLRRKV